MRVHFELCSLCEKSLPAVSFDSCQSFLGASLFEVATQTPGQSRGAVCVVGAGVAALASLLNVGRFSKLSVEPRQTQKPFSHSVSISKIFVVQFEVCARTLKEQGFAVRVIGYCGHKKLGGRLFTEHWDLKAHHMDGAKKLIRGREQPCNTVTFDTGCQMFSVTDPRAVAEVTCPVFG